MKSCKEILRSLVRRREGISLVEMILVIVALGIALPPVTRLLQMNMMTAVRLGAENKAAYFAQQHIEEIVADYANASIGYEHIETYYAGSSGYEPAEGFHVAVAISPGVLNGVNYKEIEVSCTNPQSDTVIRLKTWVVEWTS